MNMTEWNDTGKIAVYSRKSRFTGKGESIENQIELCRQYIRAQNAGARDSSILVYEDEGFSGGNLDRPQFKAMMRDARAKKFSSIVCYRLDRISRNIGDFAKLIEELESLQISFVSIREQFDTSSPMGRAMMYIASVFSQLERETIAERIRDNMRELAKTGRWLGGTTPTGYVSEAVQKVTVDGKTRKAYKLTLIPEEAALVGQIFRKFLETGSLTKTETYLVQNNLRTRNGRLFSRFAIKNLLENPVYMTADTDAYRYFQQLEVDLFAAGTEFDGRHGIMAYNKTIQTHGKTNRIRDTREWIVAVGRHPGIISGAEWVAAQRMLGRNKSKAYRRPRGNTALLSGLLVCGACGSFMRPKQSRSRNKAGEPVYAYLCELKEKSHGQNCAAKNVDGSLLDRAVCEEIKKLPADRSVFLARLEDGRRAILGGEAGCDEELERLRKSAAENEREINALVSSLAQSADTPAQSYITRQINELHDKGEGIRERIGGLEALTESRELSAPRLRAARLLLSSFGDLFDRLPVEQKRAVLRDLVGKVVWDGETAHLYLAGPAAGQIRTVGCPVRQIPGGRGAPQCEDSK